MAIAWSRETVEEGPGIEFGLLVEAARLSKTANDVARLVDIGATEQKRVIENMVEVVDFVKGRVVQFG